MEYTVWEIQNAFGPGPAFAPDPSRLAWAIQYIAESNQLLLAGQQARPDIPVRGASPVRRSRDTAAFAFQSPLGDYSIWFDEMGALVPKAFLKYESSEKALQTYWSVEKGKTRTLKESVQRIVNPFLLISWEVKEIPAPEPGPNQVLIKIHASGLCFTDVHQMRGEGVSAFLAVPRIIQSISMKL